MKIFVKDMYFLTKGCALPSRNVNRSVPVRVYDGPGTTNKTVELEPELESVGNPFLIPNNEKVEPEPKLKPIPHIGRVQVWVINDMKKYSFYERFSKS